MTITDSKAGYEFKRFLGNRQAFSPVCQQNDEYWAKRRGVEVAELEKTEDFSIEAERLFDAQIDKPITEFQYWLDINLQYAQRYREQERWQGKKVLQCITHASCLRAVVHLQGLKTGVIQTELLIEAAQLMLQLDKKEWSVFGATPITTGAITLLSTGDYEGALKYMKIKRLKSNPRGRNVVSALLHAIAEAKGGRITDSEVIGLWLEYFDDLRNHPHPTENQAGYAYISRRRPETIGSGFCASIEHALVTHKYIFSDGETNYKAALDLYLR
jgi:hypothetical protein